MHRQLPSCTEDIENVLSVVCMHEPSGIYQCVKDRQKTIILDDLLGTRNINAFDYSNVPFTDTSSFLFCFNLLNSGKGAWIVSLASLNWVSDYNRYVSLMANASWRGSIERTRRLRPALIVSKRGPTMTQGLLRHSHR